MNNQVDIVSINIVLQDKYRKILSEFKNKSITTLALGDSDVDYLYESRLPRSFDYVLDAPYNIQEIKNKLIFNGIGKDLSGNVSVFARKVLANGSVQSLYNHPTTNNFSTGVSVPKLSNGLDISQITFDNNKMGYILYFQTILDFYLDENNLNKRLDETITSTITWNGTTNIPVNWEITKDDINNSLLISKLDTTLNPVSNSYLGEIKLKGEVSKKEKTIKFNF